MNEVHLGSFNEIIQYINIYKLKVIFVGRVLLIINYLPKWRWLVVDIYWATKQ